MVKVGMIVQYPLNDKVEDETVSDCECPLLVVAVHPQKDGSLFVDGFVFSEDNSRYVTDVQPGSPSQANTYHEID
jgi:hypothetical protein